MNSDSTKNDPGSRSSNGVIPAAIAVQKPGGLFSMQHHVVFIVACSAGELGGSVLVAVSFS